MVHNFVSWKCAGLGWSGGGVFCSLQQTSCAQGRWLVWTHQDGALHGWFGGKPGSARTLDQSTHRWPSGKVDSGTWISKEAVQGYAL